jgi:hypothetical protein
MHPGTKETRSTSDTSNIVVTTSTMAYLASSTGACALVPVVGHLHRNQPEALYKNGGEAFLTQSMRQIIS